MIKLLLALTLYIATPTISYLETKTTIPTTSEVYICTGPNATKYHSTRSCKGLSNCSGTIKSVSINQANNSGYSPCRICYK